MTSQKRTLFVINIANVIDIITNSSSELFVLKAETASIAEEMIINLYPDYESEYKKIIAIEELSNEELDNFLNYHCSARCWPYGKEELPLLKGFTFDELYEAKIDSKTGKPEKNWKGHFDYDLKDNSKEKRKYFGTFVVNENRERVIKAIKETVGNYFLYSLDENPNYEKQEELEQIATRYHLG